MVGGGMRALAERDLSTVSSLGCTVARAVFAAA